MADSANLKPSAVVEVTVTAAAVQPSAVVEVTAAAAAVQPSAVVEVIEMPKEFDETAVFDTARKVSALVVVQFHSERKAVLSLTEKAKLWRKICRILTTPFDLTRNLDTSLLLNFDVIRALAANSVSAFDASRVLTKSEKEAFDLLRHKTKFADFVYNLNRQLNSSLILTYDLQRLVQRAGEKIITADFDAIRNVEKSETFLFSASRNTKKSITLYANVLRDVVKENTADFDTLQRLIKTVTLFADTKRILDADSRNFFANTRRTLERSESLAFDTVRNVNNAKLVVVSVTTTYDLTRQTVKRVKLLCDVQRITNKLHVTYKNDTRRFVKFAEVLNLDTWRSVEGPATTYADTVVYQPEDVNIGGSIFRLSKGRVISVNIQKNVQNMSDTLTLEAYDTDFTLRDRLSGTFLDYDLSGFEVSSIRTIGKKQTIIFTQNWRELAAHVRFFGDGTEHTVRIVLSTDTTKETGDSREKDGKKVDRSVYISSYYNKANLGWTSKADFKGTNTEREYTSTLKKELSIIGAEYIGTDYKIVDSARINGQTSTTLDLVNGLISWSQSVPTKQIIPLLKNGKVICLQRGHEKSITDLKSYRYPIPTIEQHESQTKLEMTYVGGTFAQYYSSGGKAAAVAYFHGFRVPVLTGPFTYTYEDGTTGNTPTKEIQVDNPEYKEYLDKQQRALQQQISHPEDNSSETIDYSYTGDPETPGAYIVEETHTLRWHGDDDRDHVKTWVVKHKMSQPQQFITHVEVGPKTTDGKQQQGSGSANQSQEKPPPPTITEEMGHVKAEAPIDWGKAGTRNKKNYYLLVYVNSLGDQMVYYSESTTNNLPLPFQPYDILNTWFKEAKKCRIIETVTLDITPEVAHGEILQKHIFGFEERYKYNGKTYFLQSNDIVLTTTSFKQTLVLVRYSPD